MIPRTIRVNLKQDFIFKVLHQMLFESSKFYVFSGIKLLNANSKFCVFSCISCDVSPLTRPFSAIEYFKLV